jgi:hypothetical protein
MSTATQTPKVQAIDVLDKASADAEVLGQKLHNALTRMYFAAQKDEDLTGDYSEAHEADVSLRAIMPEVRRAAKALGVTAIPKQGPNLRAAIEQLPAKGARLSRERLEDAPPREVIGEIHDRLVNDLIHFPDVFTAATHAWRDGENDQIRVGLYVIGDDFKDEIERIGELLWGIWKDEHGLPEDQS